MPINISVPDLAELKPRITVFGVGGGGCNAVNNMISSNLSGVEFVVANTDAQALAKSPCERKIQMGVSITQGLGAGSQPEIGAAAAEETKSEIIDHLAGSHMVFITAGMGGGTGTGAAPVIASLAREQGILTVGVVTKPFNFEGRRRMAIAERGIDSLAQNVDTLIVIPNQNLFRVANEATSFTAAFQMADQVLFSGVASITELMTKEGLINLDFADVRAVMSDMGKAMMGTGEASGESRAEEAALAAISNPLLDIDSMAGARGVLISIAGGPDLTLYEVDQAASRIREEVDPEANIIVGATIDEDLEGTMRVSVVATGLQQEAYQGAAGGAQTAQTMSGGQSVQTPGIATPTGLGSNVYAVGGKPQATSPQSETVHEQKPMKSSVGEVGNAPDIRPTMTPENGMTTPAEMELPLEASSVQHESEEHDDASYDDKTAAHEPQAVHETSRKPQMEQTGQPTAVASNNVMTPATGGEQTPAGTPGGMEAGVRIPSVEEMPSPIREMAKSKQDRIRKLGAPAMSGGTTSASSKSSILIGKVRELFGRGHSAPQPPQAGPQQQETAQKQTASAGHMPAAGVSSAAAQPESSPLQDDDGLSIPAFLRRK